VRSGVARTRLALIAGQVCCVLLVVAALPGRTFIQLLKAERGFTRSPGHEREAVDDRRGVHT
jgi:hypothetical protein